MATGRDAPLQRFYHLRTSHAVAHLTRYNPCMHISSIERFQGPWSHNCTSASRCLRIALRLNMPWSTGRKSSLDPCIARSSLASYNANNGRDPSQKEMTRLEYVVFEHGECCQNRTLKAHILVQEQRCGCRHADPLSHLQQTPASASRCCPASKRGRARDTP